MKRTRDDEQEHEKYISGAAVRATFGVSASTLRLWANTGKVAAIRFGEAGKRLYLRADIEKAFRGYRPPDGSVAGEKGAKARVCNCRVSSAPQRDDLARQEEALRREYPDHEIVKDVGSGLNWKRPGFLAMVDGAMRGGISEVVVSHRDRLCRFGFEFVKHVLARSGCVIVVQHDRDGEPDESAELRDDLLAVVTCFVASSNGKRAAANRRARKAAERERGEGGVAAAAAEEGKEGSEETDGDEVQESDDGSE